MELRLQNGSTGYAPGSGVGTGAELDRALVECGNPTCSGSWLAYLKDRRRPVLDGQWACSARCMEAMVETAIRRETIFPEGGTEHRHRMPLGLIMLAQGWITNEQLQHALDLQRRAGKGRIGEWLVAECGVDHDRVIRGLGLQWQSPVLSVAGFDPAAMALTVPKELIDRTGVVPLRIASGRILYLGWEDRPDASAAFAIARMSGLRVESGLVDAAELGPARQQLCGCEFVKATLERVGNTETLAQRMALALGRMRPRASHVVRVHHLYWLRMWLEMGSMMHRASGVPASGDDVVDCVYLVGGEQ